ncbi:hypothetical protein GON26_03905 [Flavobacterium sp. GA093]|uniref:Lipoprotein n=1 Tax=Flavobacterium hydrocarbonoxydans TaxID=2683249 RepID=A0A6I4NH33_9FLAO|nr:hypothetical protein [Flavobacterium hydrocarbonoxydans]MWB93491.1 hypothetical protein [Flavobacterium hydrocarbonoxydans]
MKKGFLLSVFFFLLTACNRNDKPIIAFYYWKTTFKLSEKEKVTLEENNVSKIYIRYFDIDLHPKTKVPFPVSPIHFKEKPTAYNIVPVVYLKNQVLLQPNLNIDDLAQKTVNFINTINQKNNLNGQEIQIDCDWTLATKTIYLEFIEKIKKLSHKKLSATIRLHQVKYFKKTKIPNVDSGVLMYYNIGTISADSSNSIYEKKIADRYLKSLKKYPLQLNFALPIYSWAVHIKNQKVIGLKSKLNVSDLQKDTNFVKIKTNYFRVKHANYKGGTFYEKDDLLKTEAITAADLTEMAEDLNENSAQAPKEIIFYDLDEFNLNNYEKNIFEQVVSCF